MSNTAVRWVRTEVVTERPTQRHVLLILADSKNDATGQCNPSIETIMGSTGLSKSAVIRALKWLELNGFIKVTRRHRNGNSYLLGLDFNGVTQPPKEDELKVSHSHLRGVTQPPNGVTETPYRCHTATPTRKNQKRTGIEQRREPLEIDIEDKATPEEFQAAWNEAFKDYPNIPKIQSMTLVRRTLLRGRYHEYPDKRFTDDHWPEIFEWCKASDFLMGLEPPTPRYPEPFELNVDLFLSPEFFTKLLDKRYHRKRGYG